MVAPRPIAATPTVIASGERVGLTSQRGDQAANSSGTTARGTGGSTVAVITTHSKLSAKPAFATSTRVNPSAAAVSVRVTVRPTNDTSAARATLAAPAPTVATGATKRTGTAPIRVARSSSASSPSPTVSLAATATPDVASSSTSGSSDSGTPRSADTAQSASATSPPGVTAANFHGIVTGPGGYEVNAQADPALAQQVLDESNAAIRDDLANGSNGFGVGGYQFPSGAPFGLSNPLFTGQTYGPTWFEGSGSPEPPPSQWAIDPITGLPHEPATGAAVTPSMWAVNPWNPESPNYDRNLYVAAGQTPPQ